MDASFGALAADDVSTHLHAKHAAREQLALHKPNRCAVGDTAPKAQHTQLLVPRVPDSGTCVVLRQTWQSIPNTPGQPSSYPSCQSNLPVCCGGSEASFDARRHNPNSTREGRRCGIGDETATWLGHSDGSHAGLWGGLHVWVQALVCC